MITEYFTKLHNFILDILFPVHCLRCQKYNDWICEKCFSKINILQVQFCPYCEKIISPNGRICQQCKNKFLKTNEIWPLDGLIASATYGKNGVSDLIYCFKYNFISDLGLPLARILCKAFLLNNLFLPDIIIPIPLHQKRLRWRGFNQAEILANYFAENITPGFSVSVISNFIIRKKYTGAQMKIKNYQERQKNVRNIFTLNKKFLQPKILEGKTVLLIDDIATTGSTLFEAGRIIKLAGAVKVFAIVIARQEIKNTK